MTKTPLFLFLPRSFVTSFVTGRTRQGETENVHAPSFIRVSVTRNKEGLTFFFFLLHFYFARPIPAMVTGIFFLFPLS